MGTYTNYSKLEVDGTISSSVQGELIGTFTSMPSASALNEGKTIYYTGATSGNYVQNTFYTCTKSGSTYSWTSASPKQVSVDSALSETSTNPVQNKVIATKLKEFATKDDISTVYKPKGSVASANLPSNPRIGDVYNLTDNSSYGPAGTNVVYTENGWDALAGIVDISGKQDKISAGTGISLSGNTVSLATSGVTAGTKGSATAVPVITVDAYGRITSISTSTIYPPTSAGTSGQIWASDGSGQGVWQSKDTTPTSGSTNAITSGAVHSELAKKQNNLTFDSAPTASSSNPVTSGGVYTALQAKQNNLTFDSTPTSGSSNPVTSGGVYSAINGKQDKLTFDSTPKSGSNNPVTSGGIFTAINAVNVRTPTSDGTAGQVWMSDGNGTGIWGNLSSGMSKLAISSTMESARMIIFNNDLEKIVYDGAVTMGSLIATDSGQLDITITQFGNTISKQMNVNGDAWLNLSDDIVNVTIPNGIASPSIADVPVVAGSSLNVIKNATATIKADLESQWSHNGVTQDMAVNLPYQFTQNETLKLASEPFIISSSGGSSFTIPKTGTYEIVLAGGGGGGGGGYQNTNQNGIHGAGDGGSSGQIFATSAKYTKGTSVSLSLGFGGDGGVAPGGKGKSGGTTTFGDFSALGGAGGNGGTRGTGKGGHGGNSSGGTVFGVTIGSIAGGEGGTQNTESTSSNKGSSGSKPDIPSLSWLPDVLLSGDGGHGGVRYSATNSYYSAGGGKGGVTFGTFKGGDGGYGGYQIGSGSTHRRNAGPGSDGSSGGIALRFVV